MFTDEQKRALSADLDKGNVRSRSQGGRALPYIAGWKVIEEANRIFGFDGWTRNTIETKCVAEYERTLASGGKGWGVTYIAKVRILVGDTIVRDGTGAGHGIDRDLGLAHESAIKEAETDAMKRALMTFGNPFGLALYDKEQAHVSDTNGNGHVKEPPQAVKDAAFRQAAVTALKTEIDAFTDVRKLEAWGKDANGRVGDLLQSEREDVRTHYATALRTLQGKGEKAA